MTDGNRYIGDRVFDELMEIPGFKDKARELIKKDWYIGSNEFQVYAEPLIDSLPFEVTNPSDGDLSLPYVASRIMGRLDIRTEPWLWAYAQLTGALIKSDEVRFALNAIQSGTK